MASPPPLCQLQTRTTGHGVLGGGYRQALRPVSSYKIALSALCPTLVGRQAAGMQVLMVGLAGALPAAVGTDGEAPDDEAAEVAVAARRQPKKKRRGIVGALAVRPAHVRSFLQGCHKAVHTG